MEYFFYLLCIGSFSYYSSFRIKYKQNKTVHLMFYVRKVDSSCCCCCLTTTVTVHLIDMAHLGQLK